MNFDFGTGTNRTYNFISIGFLVAAALTCIITLLILLLGGGGGADAIALPPTISIPTSTATWTPTITRTPLPATFTPTFTPTSTSVPSLTPSPTFTTSPTLSPTPTITTTSLPSDTPTETSTFAPTLGTPPPSPSPYLFALQAPAEYTQLSVVNPASTVGCQWQGIAGQVLDLNGNAYPTALTISVTGGGLPTALTTVSGSNSIYGAGGYELQMSNGVNTQTYFVQLLTPSGTPVTEVIQVTFPGDCSQNVAILRFQQTRPN